VPILKVKDYQPVRALKNLFFTILFNVDGGYLQGQFKWYANFIRYFATVLMIISNNNYTYYFDELHYNS